ncbi:hypothetical protein ACFU96_43265 [Streptomyces sp. NPDC057620]|uniref:hypothetical protein n=1 Tax=Streptomyces sp. NPDC057620 TaxID=3346185 RepID=UPI003699EC77
MIGGSSPAMENKAVLRAAMVGKHRHYADLIDTHFRPRVPVSARAETHTDRPEADERRETNLQRLRQENTDLRRTLALYEEAIRQLSIENDALRNGATVVPLLSRSSTAPHSPA